MENHKNSNIEAIARQLNLIEETNELINNFKKKNDDLMTRQYEHLKNKLIKNLFKMLNENYQIPMPKLEAA